MSRDVPLGKAGGSDRGLKPSASSLGPASLTHLLDFCQRSGYNRLLIEA
jgi:hypothetical protein